MKTNKKHIRFRKNLMIWHQDIDRALPWKKTSDPYKIWLSEIILQQTRVDQGTDYYLRLVKRFPKVEDLANATEDVVLSMWKGLGYYARARNMHVAAQQIVSTFGGAFPTTFAEILSLKGVGPYTAAAISSFAFDLPHAVLDGNVYRVLSRVFGISTAIDSTDGKKLFAQLAHSCLDQDHPAKYNQAIMDFGAIHCKPYLPECESCLMDKHCEAYAHTLVDLLPVKKKKSKVKSRYFHYLVFRRKNQIFLEKRQDQDIWKGLYQPPLIESEKGLTKRKLLVEIIRRYDLKDIGSKDVKKILNTTQRLTHRLIHGAFYQVEGSFPLKGGMWIDIDKSAQVGMPSLVDKFIKTMM